MTEKQTESTETFTMFKKKNQNTKLIQPKNQEDFFEEVYLRPEGLVKNQSDEELGREKAFQAECVQRR